MSDREQKDESREMVADIVAFISKCLDLLDTELTRMSNKEHALSADALLCPVLNAKAALDRIDAARKREKAEIEADALAVGGIVEAARTAEKSSAVGNAAAMRGALVKAKKAICHHAEYVCRSLAWENSNIQSNCADILCAHRDLCEAKTAINAALSEPPRNCDRFGGDYKILHTAWFDWTGSPRGHLPDGTAKLAFARWLLEMDETMKGDDNGSK